MCARVHTDIFRSIRYLPNPVPSKKKVAEAYITFSRLLTSLLYGLRDLVRSNMARPLLDEELWVRLPPLIPRPRRRCGHRHDRGHVTDRAALTGILYVLRSGVP